MNTLKTGLLMALLFGLLMLIGRWVAGPTGVLYGFVFALIMNFGAYWFSDKIALSMNGAQEVSEAEAPQLYRIVRQVAMTAGMPMPRVYIIPTPQPNAFATGRNPSHAAVAATQGILQMLTPEELEGVIAHEMAHVKHRDTLITTIAATIAGAIGMIAHMLQFAMMFGGYGYDDRDRRGGANPLVMLLVIIVAPIAALLIQLAVTRAREYEADAGGAEITGRPLALASALRKIESVAERAPMNVNPATAHLYIVNPLGGDALQSVAALFRTHPLTADRIARLQEMAQHMGVHGYGVA